MFTCMSVCALRMCLVPMEARRRWMPGTHPRQMEGEPMRQCRAQ